MAGIGHLSQQTILWLEPRIEKVLNAVIDGFAVVPIKRCDPDWERLDVIWHVAAHVCQQILMHYLEFNSGHLTG